jgi:CTP synthase (UTP-ammonia lyase)
LGIVDAEHEESAPDAATLVISRLACSLVGTAQEIILSPGSLVASIYAEPAVTEDFACNYGLNPAYQERLASGDLQPAGYDAEGDLRLVELRGHPFFVATLFLPQLRSWPGRPHPLIAAFLAAAQAHSPRAALRG